MYTFLSLEKAHDSLVLGQVTTSKLFFAISDSAFFHISFMPRTLANGADLGRVYVTIRKSERYIITIHNLSTDPTDNRRVDMM